MRQHYASSSGEPDADVGVNEMGEIQKLNKPPVEPIYSQSQVNETIPLGKLRVEFELDGGLQQADATIELTFGRRSDFRILLDESSLSPGIGTQLALDDSWDGKLRLVDIGLTIDAFSVGNHELAPCRSGLSFTRTPSPLVRAVAHLFNFPTFTREEGVG
jgi:hypothetical protein